MMRNCLKAAVLAAVAASALPAPASDASTEEIVVEGDRAEVLEKAKTFVNDVAYTPGTQLARFHTPVCPAAAGLSPEAIAWLVGRVRAIAEEIGPGQAKPDCDPNLLVIATDDVAGLVKDISKRRPRWLDGLTSHELRRLKETKGPVAAWAVTSLRNEDGEGIRSNSQANSPGGSSSDPLNQYSNFLRVRSASILRKPTTQYMDGTIILVDRKALVDRPLLQLSDYVAMRGLAQLQPPESSTVATILSAFTPDENDGTPFRLTESDYAYLQALYKVDESAAGHVQKTRIAEAIAKFEEPQTK